MWLWLISNIAGSLLGTATSAWFKDTKLGKWSYRKFEAIANWAANRYGIDILNKEETSWRTKYPHVAQKIDDLEKRIEELENGLDKR